VEIKRDGGCWSMIKGGDLDETLVNEVQFDFIVFFYKEKKRKLEVNASKIKSRSKAVVDLDLW
jgi:hypothetical protein